MMNIEIAVRNTVFVLGCAILIQKLAIASEFTMSSPSIKHLGIVPNEHVFNGFGCSGGNQSPELGWKNAPPQTQSFAVTVFDPDAPTDSGWWHWLVYNLTNAATGVSFNAGRLNGDGLPEGTMQGRSDFGTIGFGGPCPPEGAKPHRYVFTVYALKVKTIDLPDNASAALTSFLIKSNAIGQASLTAVYGR